MNDLINRQDAIDLLLDRGMITAAIYVERIPSAELEVIYCKYCKWKQGSECVRFADVRPFPNDFCSRAERRTEDE